MSDEDLPQGWAKVQLNDLVLNPKADLVDGPFGSNLKSSEYVEYGIPVLKIQNIKADRFVGKRLSYVTKEKAMELSRHSFIAGDLMITKLGEPLGLCCEVPSYLEHGIFVADLMRLRPSSEIINSKFLLHAINSVVVQNQFKGITKGTTRQRVNLSIVREIKIALPPLNEQHRIVAKLEELFSELDKGIESLKIAREQLRVYRQALLKYAFEGKLTVQWRAENRNKLEPADALLARIQAEREQRYREQLQQWEAAGKSGSKPKAPKPLSPLTAEELAELPELPEGWGWVRPEEIAAPEPYAIGIGPFGSNLKVSDYRDSGVPLIFVKNITRSNFVTDLKYIDLAKYEELTAHSVRSLDLLITKMGDPPGDCEVYPAGSPDAVLTADCLKFRLWEKFIDRQLYKFCINSNFVKRQLGLITRGVAQKKISVERFKTIALPLLSVVEQKVLVGELEAKLSEVDQLDQTLTTSLQQAEVLRQSILKKAFSGQLVAQDANDEPAIALLARIKAEKAAQAVAAKPKLHKAAKPESTRTNVIPFPAKISGISHSELHAGIMALAYRQHELSRRAWYFGHVKAEKISHMVESFLGIDLDRKPIKDAAGPNDFKRLLAVEAQARELRWFDVQKQKSGRHLFHKMEGFDDLVERTSAALGERLDSVKALIGHFIGWDKTRSEIVATLYAAWNNLLLLGRIPSDEEIVLEATQNWHEDKLKIRRERFFNCLGWMRSHGLVPKGRGRYVAKKGEKPLSGAPR